MVLRETEEWMKSSLPMSLFRAAKKAPSINPERFDDRIALKTRREPLKKGVANFRTHELIARGNRLEFRRSIQFRILSFGLIGVGVLCFLLIFSG